MSTQADQDTMLVVATTTTDVAIPPEQQHCKNCDTLLQGEYCHACGQHHRQYIRSIFAVVGDLFGEIGHWDSRFYRTMVSLFLRPGFLSLEFAKGRHASYVPPLRLYFFVSLVAFLVLSLTFKFEVNVPVSQPQEAQQGQQSTSLTDDIDWSQIQVNAPWLTTEEQAAFAQRLQYLGENPRLLVQKLVSLAPQMMLLMLPFWALFLKLAYVCSGRYYLEHLTVALHTHAFLLLSLLLDSVFSYGAAQLGSWLQSPLPGATADWFEQILLVWMVTYMLFTQKLYYQQGWRWTLVKFVYCGLAYSLLLTIAFIVMLIYGVMTA